MFRTLFGSLLLLAAVSCSQAYSDGRAASAPQPMMVAGDPARAAPYGVEIIDERGNVLPTFEQHGKFYVLGDADDRYLIRVSNPTDRRVEAVVTVDGLDVIDGEPGDLRKRGYVVPAGGELRIEGWRTSTSEVATFRFSSVGDSYAGRKGKARNVGVIAVALFDEVPPQEIILDQSPPPPVTYYDEGYDEESIKDYGGDGDAPSSTGGGSGGYAPRRDRSGGEGRAEKRAPVEAEDGAVMRPPPPPHDPQPEPKKECCTAKSKRPGLGTEYGEQRYSAATWTRFVRASETPVAIAELRYNDADGLAALGIPVSAPVDEAELTKRETADPFPGDGTFAPPPRR